MGTTPRRSQALAALLPFSPRLARSPESAAAVERPALLEEFNSWMRSHRGVRERTLDRYGLVIECLLRTLGDEVESYDAKKLRDFVLNLAKRYSTTSTKNVTTAVRMFLQFLIATKRCRVGLEACIPTVLAYHRLPNYLSVDAIERIVAACPKTTQVGARDRAIILLLARLGLAQARWQGSSSATLTGSRER